MYRITLLESEIILGLILAGDFLRSGGRRRRNSMLLSLPACLPCDWVVYGVIYVSPISTQNIAP